jgi:hypothetical protein
MPPETPFRSRDQFPPPLYRAVCKHRQPLDIREGDSRHFFDTSDGIGSTLPARYPEQKIVAECLIIARRQLSFQSVSVKDT